jgi:hypothetical protein
MKPDYTLIDDPADPLYDAGHPIKYKADAYGTNLRFPPDGDLANQLPDDISLDSASTYSWTVALVPPGVRPTGPGQVFLVATKS